MSCTLTLFLLPHQDRLKDFQITCGDHKLILNDYSLIGQIFDFSFHAKIDPTIPKEPSISTYPLIPGTKVEIFDGEKMRLTDRNPSGTPITFTWASELKKLQLPQDCPELSFDRATVEFFKHIPDEIPVILYLK